MALALLTEALDLCVPADADLAHQIQSDIDALRHFEPRTD